MRGKIDKNICMSEIGGEGVSEGWWLLRSKHMATTSGKAKSDKRKEERLGPRTRDGRGRRRRGGDRILHERG